MWLVQTVNFYIAKIIAIIRELIATDFVILAVIMFLNHFKCKSIWLCTAH